MKAKLSVLAAVIVAAGLHAGVAAAASSPGIATGGASSITTSSAVLHGTANPNGSATTYYFQWGLANTYGLLGSMHKAGAGTKPVAIQTTATQLTPGTVYHYRVVATNALGTTVGADRTVRTAGHPPALVITGAATALGPFAVTLTGTINPNGAATTWSFQYGLTTAYGLQTASGSLPASTTPTNISIPIQGLQPATTFHYRLVAFHGAAVESPGADATFTTEPFPRPKPRIHALTTPRTAHRRPFAFLDAYQLQMEQTIMPDVTFEAFIVAGLAILLWKPRPALHAIALGGFVLGVSATVRQVGEILIVPAVAFCPAGRARLAGPAGVRQPARRRLRDPGPGVHDVFGGRPARPVRTVRSGQRGPLRARRTGRTDCAALHVPAAERSLCPSPAVAAWGIDRIINNADGPLGSYRRYPGKQRPRRRPVASASRC